ncbi:ABC-F family ATP-binding cassette domain-containing protein [Hydrogenoanaerobacterium sp.]|uniref:ABC-F family ATP-binding cassette domain-containing protein n=1 Tax=Hydrogenoanaerobacterium sp. TaxID=2953763 RepID=UPI002898D8A9|nr:ABC-F family ATP-binding cassette domain-containing protein [Hydrogenoanaerobacterium sp.]
MILSANGISKSYGSNLVLKETDLKIEDNDRIGLVGVNGAGKSTLLNLLTQRELPDTGDVFISNAATIGFLRQNSGLNTANTIWAEMQSVFAPLLAVQDELRYLEKQLAKTEAATAEFDALTKQYATQSEWFEKQDGYLIDVKIKTILNGMGFADKPYETMINTLSGGEKTRLAMAKLLLEAPQLLILDEPTNHLDFRTLMWLEEYLGSYKGALLVVSHDRYFLDKLITTVWEVERHQLSRYKGNYTKYVSLKAEARVRQQKEYEIQQQQIASMKDYVARNIARASTSKSAKSRIAALERMDVVDRPGGDLKAAHLSFEYDREPVKDVLDVTGLSLEVGEGSTRKTLCKGIDLHIFRGEKIALIGANGIGKSTFLKVIQDLIPYHTGYVEWGKNVTVGYYEQENKSLHAEKTVLDELWDRYPRMPEHSVRSALGSVLITGEEVYKQVSVLSGGERAKLSFAILMQGRANTLILDEPTNHLDLVSKEILEQALMEFSGTLIMVSHDRYMLNKIPDKIVEFTGDSIKAYIGKFDDYLTQTDREKQQAAADVAIPQAKPSAGGYRSREQKNLENQRRQRARELEVLIGEAEEYIKVLEQEISTEEVFSDYQLMTEKCSELELKKEQLAELSDEWLELIE